MSVYTSYFIHLTGKPRRSITTLLRTPGQGHLAQLEPLGNGEQGFSRPASLISYRKGSEQDAASVKADTKQRAAVNRSALSHASEHRSQSPSIPDIICISTHEQQLTIATLGR